MFDRARASAGATCDLACARFGVAAMPTRRRAPQPAPQLPNLPAEMIVAIVRASKHGPTLVTLRQVCKAWRRAIDAESASLWREVALERFPRIRDIVAAANVQAPCYRSLYRTQLETERAFRHGFRQRTLDGYVLTAELQLRALSVEGDRWYWLTLGRGSARLADTLEIDSDNDDGAVLDGGRITLARVQPAYANMEKKPIGEWGEQLQIRFLVTRVADMKTAVICELESSAYAADEVGFDGNLERIPEMLERERMAESPLDVTMEARLTQSTMTVSFAFVEFDNNSGGQDTLFEDELKIYLEWYARWPNELTVQEATSLMPLLQ